MQHAIIVKNIKKVFHDIPRHPLHVIDDITLSIGLGEFFVMVGSSGSGKSTLLRIMAGLEKQYEGEVVYGNELSKKDMSFVFQQFGLLPWLTVEQNVELNLIERMMPDDMKKKKVHEELEKL